MALLNTLFLKCHIRIGIGFMVSKNLFYRFLEVPYKNMKVNKKKLKRIINKAKNKKIKTDMPSEYINNDQSFLLRKTHYTEDFIIRNK